MTLFKKTKFTPLCLLLGMLLSSVSPATASHGDGQVSGALPISRIVGGTETGADTWQSVVMIRSDYPVCTGTLIHPRIVLTAAHCIYQVEGEMVLHDYRSFPEALGVYGGAAGETLLSGVIDLVVFTEWSGETAQSENDAALLLLAEAPTGIPPLPLRVGEGPKAGASARIVGYGADLKSVSLTASLRRRVGETTLLAVSKHGLETGGASNSCSGDSGGPVLTEQDGDWRISGVISFGAASCPTMAEGYALHLLGYCEALSLASEELLGEPVFSDDCARLEETDTMNPEPATGCSIGGAGIRPAANAAFRLLRRLLF